MNKAIVPIILVAGGVGAYYIISNRDDTPVGLVVRKSLNSGKNMGKDGDKEYRYAIVDGSFRATESSLSLDSFEGQDALLVIFEDDSPIEARIIDPEAWDDEKHNDLVKEYGFDAPEEEETVEEPVLNNAQTQNAESVMFGHVVLNALQSNHSW
jgi:hypothetical protein